MIQCQGLQCRAFNCRQLCLSSLRTWASDFRLLRTLNHKTFEKTLSFNCVVKLIYHIHIWNITHDIYYIYIYIISTMKGHSLTPHRSTMTNSKKVQKKSTLLWAPRQSGFRFAANNQCEKYFFFTRHTDSPCDRTHLQYESTHTTSIQRWYERPTTQK